MRISDWSSDVCSSDLGRVPYGWRATGTQPGVFRLGDQAGVIPSLAGEGIGIALGSAQCAIRHWREGGSAAAPAYQHAFARQMRRPIAVAELDRKSTRRNSSH